MATKLPPLKRLAIEDYPAEVRKWIPKLLDPLNDFIRVVYQNINGNLSINNNMLGFIKTLKFTKQETYPGETTPLEFTNTMNVKPVAVIVGKIEENESPPQPVTNSVCVEWTYIDGIIKIRNITGLTNGIKYYLTLLVFGG